MNRRFFKRAAAFVVASLMAVGVITVLPDECFPQFGIAVSADDIVKSGKCGDNITYTVDSKGLITISGTGEMYDHVWYYPDPNPFLDAVECVIEDGVTSIGSFAFNSCEKLTNVSIPDSVAKINPGAFFSCNNLTSVNLPNSIKSIGRDAFEYSGLTNINIPNGVTSIENATFCFCKNLTSVTIPDSVTRIGNNAFQECSLESITIPYGVTSIEDAAFSHCSNLTNVILPNSVINIGPSAFYQCESLTNITIPDSVRTIGGSAFFGCSLTSITLPDSVTNIGSFAFSFCESLSNVTIPNSVVTINDGTFRYCTNLTNIIIPDSVTKIGSGAFTCCDNLMRILIPDSVAEISEDTISYGEDGVTSTTVGHVFDFCTNLIIYGYEDTYAQSYAEKHNIPFEYACYFYSPAVHNLEYVPEKAATATVHGCKEYWTCTVCGNVFADEDGTNETTLEALMSHNQRAELMSDTTGHWYTCSGCDEKLDFSVHTEDNGTVTVEPTETTEGQKVYKCAICGYTTRTEVVSKLENADGIEINSENFPDEIFRQYVSDNFDKDNNDLLSNDEIRQITRIDIYNMGIQSFKGIEYFSSLTYLYCGVNKLTTLDLSKNTALRFLNCGSNQLTSLDVSNNTVLTDLHCDKNKLTSLNVGDNTALTTLQCDDNQLISLDLSNNTVLTRLYCGDNQLTSLDLSNNIALTTLSCDRNSYDIGEISGEYDLKNLPTGFDITKASNWQGATLKDDTLMEIDDNGIITYNYDCGNNHTATFKLTYNYVESGNGDDSEPTVPTTPTNPTQPTQPTTPTASTNPQQPAINESETIISAKNGWGNVVKQINAANENSKITVDMGNTTNVPKNVMNAIKGKNIDIVLDMGDGITWTINGKDVTDPQSIDFSVTKKKNSIPQNLISDPNNTIPLVLAHNGNFGCSATLSIELEGNDKKIANLYYYNSKTKELEFVDSDEIVNGKANLVFTHASDWAIVISDISAEYEDVSSAAGVYEADDNSQAPLCMIVIIIAAVGFSSIIIAKRFAKKKH